MVNENKPKNETFSTFKAIQNELFKIFDKFNKFIFIIKNKK